MRKRLGALAMELLLVLTATHCASPTTGDALRASPPSSEA
jgi:hypothetical protein